MGKGDARRPSQLSQAEEAAAYERIFGPPKLNVMSEEERKEMLAEKERLASGGTCENAQDSHHTD